MKRLSFAIMLALCTMGVWAQEGIKVEFEGANPNIFDFAWSYLINYDPNTEDYEATSGIRDALERYLQNENQDDNVTLIVDKKAGFISYEHLHQGHAQLIEMCFWNEADKKHKLFAYSNWSYFNGHPELGLRCDLREWHYLFTPPRGQGHQSEQVGRRYEKPDHPEMERSRIR